MSPDYNHSLREELFGCFKYLHIPYSELLRMPVKDRKYFIKRHNEVTEAETKQDKGMELQGNSLNNIADMTLRTNTR